MALDLFLMEYKIRKTRGSDRDRIFQLLVQLTSKPPDRGIFDQAFDKNSRQQDTEYWVLEFKKEVTGFISIHSSNPLHHEKPVHEIQEFIVDASQRGKGLGSALMLFVLDRFSGGIIELSANKSRKEAKAFYEGHGFSCSHDKFVYFKESL